MLQREDPVYLAADLGDCGAYRVRELEVGGPYDSRRALQLVVMITRQYYSPSPDKDHGHRLAGRLYHVNRLLDVLDYLGDCRLHELLLQLLRAGVVDLGAPRHLAVAVRDVHVPAMDGSHPPG